MISMGFDQPDTRPTPRLTGARWVLCSFLAVGAASCGSPPPSGSSLDENGKAAGPGDVVAKPNGGLFIVDPSKGGNASDFRIEEMYYGRLVEVYDFDASAPGGGASRLQFSDFVIGEDVGSDGINFLVETNPVTQRTRLTILRVNDLDNDDDEFDQLLLQAEESARPLAAKDIVALPPFPFVARNAAIAVRFSDALDHTTINGNTIKVLAGDPPTDPVETRIFPDPNHGILRRSAGGTVEFHSTRIVIDLAVSALEFETTGIPANALGLPASESTNVASVALRIPAQTNFSASQFQNLRNASGHGISTDPTVNGPIDTSSPTLDTVRAFRSGNESDTNNGFMRDLRPPRIVGEQTTRVLTAAGDTSPGALAGFDFVVDLLFDDASCAPRPRVGQVIDLGNGFFEVLADAAAPISGKVNGVRVRSLQREASESSELLGSGLYLSTFDLANGDRAECFVSFIPRPEAPPTEGVEPLSQIRMRFSEPLDPASVTGLDSFLVTQDPIDPEPTDVISGRILPSADLQTFIFSPQGGFPHEQGIAERYFFGLDLGVLSVADLAGNVLAEVPDPVEFTLRNSAPALDLGHYVLRFGDRDEDNNSILNAAGEVIQNRPEIRGQFLYNQERGSIRPRPVSRFSAVADRNTPVTSLMAPLPAGLQTPLSPLGSRLMHVWRYCDFNFSLLDETRHNLDVEGVSWMPKNGQVISDAFDEFRIRMTHGNRLPDERLNEGNLPEYENSGLKKGEFESVGSTGNLLEDPMNPLTVVHPKELGYTIDPSQVYTSDSGTRLMPFPLNRDSNPEDDVYYTWRDTAILGRGGPDGIGVDLHILVTAQLVELGDQGQAYGATQVPSIGLPLLLEYGCYPGSGSGLNAFDVSLAINSSAQPNFRLFATGGTDSGGSVVTKDPDTETKASGGFNPSNGGGKVKGFDVTYYHGALDIVVRVSRVMTMWIDGGDLETSKDWIEPVIEPTAQFQPKGTEVIVEYRGALSAPIVSPSGANDWIDEDGNVFDAFTYDPYGDPLRDEGVDGAAPAPFWGATNPAFVNRFTANFLNDDETWHADINDLDGSQLIQARVTFIGDPLTGQIAELSGLGIPFERQ